MSFCSKVYFAAKQVDISNSSFRKRKIANGLITLVFRQGDRRTWHFIL